MFFFSFSLYLEIYIQYLFKIKIKEKKILQIHASEIHCNFIIINK